MKKTLLFTGIISFTLFASQIISAQGPSIPHRGCATMEAKAAEEALDPSIKTYRAKLEEEARIFIENNKKNPQPQTVVTIPVVFHVVYKGPASGAGTQNVSDACLQAQLKVMNDDFRKMNADASKVTQTGWPALAADCEIQFCLAVRDPNNNPTTGITRTSTTKGPFGPPGFPMPDSVKYTAHGGINAWDHNKYFNIWVCDLYGSLLGYGQFPGGNAATDGLAMDYQYMIGAQGCGTAPYDKGRTAVHELGHCFGLKHIWGDDGNADGVCNDGANQCNGSDGIADTPNQCDCHGGPFAPGSVQTDACTPSAPGTMWMNYMDYTDDGSMYMFTQGQKAVIQAAMNGYHAPLKTSNGCTPLTAVEYLYSSESVSLFPNPSTGDVALNVNIPNFSTADVTVYNAMGNAVLNKNINVNTLGSGNDVKLDMNNNANGMYFVRVQTPDGSVTKKLIINR